MNKKELSKEIGRLNKLVDLLSWLYVMDGACGSGREWRDKLLKRIKAVVLGDAEYVDLLEWMIRSHNSFDSKNEWREEFIKNLSRAV